MGDTCLRGVAEMGWGRGSTHRAGARGPEGASQPGVLQGAELYCRMCGPHRHRSYKQFATVFSAQIYVNSSHCCGLYEEDKEGFLDGAVS